MLHRAMPHVSLQRLIMASTWFTEEGHSFAAATYFAWHNRS
jgi:hypothetical protein